MSKEEIVENIKDRIGDCMFQNEIDSYTKGYLDALCETYEISWDERFEIEEKIKDE